MQVAEINHKDQARSRRSHRSKRPSAAATRHGSYVFAPSRKSSDPHPSASPTTPFPLHAAYRMHPPPRDCHFTLLPMHASFALCRLA
jgi:hypothetical protein